MVIKQQSISKKSADCRLRSAVCPRAVCPRAGFTLLELMTVMVIMFILMGMSTLALRGLMRGVGISGAVSNVRSMLTQARQQAIMNQQPTAVLFTQAGTTNTMQILASYGRVAGGGSGGFTPESELPWTASELANVVVYNFRGDRGTFTGNSHNDEIYTFGIQWRGLDDIAFQVGAVRPLPDGIEFDGLPSQPVVVFNADGSTRNTLDIRLKEQRRTSAAATVSVDPGSGWITVEMTGAPE